MSPNKNSMFVKKSVFLTNQSGNQFKFNFEKTSDIDADTNTDEQTLNTNMNNLNIKKNNTITFHSDNSFRFNFGED